MMTYSIINPMKPISTPQSVGPGPFSAAEKIPSALLQKQSPGQDMVGQTVAQRESRVLQLLPDFLPGVKAAKEAMEE